MDDSIIQIVKKYDKALNTADSKKYRLSIQLSPDGFSFCIFNADSRKFLSIESVSFPSSKTASELGEYLKQYFSQNSWLKLDYMTSCILYESDKTTLIPSPLFDKSEKNSYSDFNFVSNEMHEILYDETSILDAYLLYSIPKEVLNTINELSPTNNIYSHASRLIEGLLISNKNLQNQIRAFVNVRNTHLDLIFMKSNKLLYFNTFQYQTKEDFIYYVIYVMEQLELNPEKVELKLSGYIDKNSTLFELLYKYIRNITFQKPSDSVNFSYVFSDIPLHYYYNLLNHGLCE